MAPDHASSDPGHPSSKVERLVDAASAFSQTLLNLLSAGNPKDIPATNDLVSQTTTHIDKLHICTQRYIPGISGDVRIAATGTKLWNLCTRLRRECDASTSTGKRINKLVIYGRILALYLLVIGKPKETIKAREIIRVLKLMMKGGRDLVEYASDCHGKEKKKMVEGEDGKKELVVATALMEVAADYKGVLQTLEGKSSAGGKNKGLGGEEEMGESGCLEVEYFLLRAGIGWVDRRLDVAEHMYVKTERLHKLLTPTYAERLSDLVYEIGKWLLTQNEYTLAVKWLERANVIINAQNLEQLSREGVELRMAIMQLQVSAFLGIGTPDGLEKARNLVDYVESEVGSTKLVVSLLKLELLQKTPTEVFDDDAYSEVLRRMIRNFNSSDSGFKLIVHHIRKLHDKSPGAGCAVMDDFILHLRGGEERPEWMEKVIIQRMWMIANQRDSVATVEAVESVVSQLTRPLSPEASVGAQALMWKKLEICYNEGQFDLCEKWCQISLNSVFQNGGSVNRSKIERKLLLCALSQNNMDGALSIIRNMSKQNWDDEPITAYLAFKVAIRIGDRDLAESCLEAVSKTTDHIDYLGACIAESQKAEDIYCAISGLRKLHGKYEHQAPNKIHLPALFRCAIRLLNYLLEEPGEQDKKSEIVEELCCEFDAVVAAIKQYETSPEAIAGDTAPKLFTVDELEWFSRNAYNMALKNTSNWDLRFVVRMLTACVEIISRFPTDYSVENMIDLSLKMLFSRFIISSALVSLGRVQDHVEQRRADYKEMRAHIEKFDEGLMNLLVESERVEGPNKGCLDQQSKMDMSRKLATLLVFDFEAAVTLGQWDDLGVIVGKVMMVDREGEKAANVVVPFQAMSDCLLRAASAADGGGRDGDGKLPGQVLYSTMRKLVNEIWVLEAFDAVKLAKYTRCLFQATLPLDDSLAMNLLEESCRKARELRESNSNHWPDEELEWIATMSFNHAIDCYGTHETERAREWASRAIELAHFCNDQGGLERSMRKKFSSMKFDQADGVGEQSEESY